MGWLKLIGCVAIITTAGPAIGGTRMTKGTVIELGGLGERIDRQKTVDVRIVLMGAVGPLNIPRAPQHPDQPGYQ
jgi:hypothetical protein